MGQIGRTEDASMARHEPECAQCGIVTLMLVFIDESGDPGQKIDRGSSEFFVLAVVMFEDHGEAARCERDITNLATALGRGLREFKFSKDSHVTRVRFLDAVRPYGFTYCVFVLNKDPKKLYGPGSTPRIHSTSGSVAPP